MLTKNKRRSITNDINYLPKRYNNMKDEEFIIPAEYREPSASDNYVTYKQGDNRFRILSNMVMGWEEWKTVDGSRKVTRYHHNQKPKPVKDQDDDEKPKLFWAFVVWNYEEAKVQILNIKQSSIRKALQKISQDAEWGNAMKYDLKITKSGESKKSVYAVTPCPQSPLNKVIAAAKKSTAVNLEALFTNGDPFEVYDTPYTQDTSSEEPCEF